MKFVRKYQQLLPVFLYGIFYLKAFQYLESINKYNFHIIHSALDDMIPFCPYFIIPYLLWFVYIAVAVFWFGVCDQNRTEYYHLIVNLGIGMTIFLFISWIYPNGQLMRPRNLGNDTIFLRLVNMIYSNDTPTNIFPSVHVYNSVAIAMAVEQSQVLKKHRPVQIASTILAVLICLSTMFLKQHSVWDVSCALLLNSLMYSILYAPQSIRLSAGARTKERKHQSLLIH